MDTYTVESRTLNPDGTMLPESEWKGALHRMFGWMSSQGDRRTSLDRATARHRRLCDCVRWNRVFMGMDGLRYPWEHRVVNDRTGEAVALGGGRYCPSCRRWCDFGLSGVLECRSCKEVFVPESDGGMRKARDRMAQERGMS